MNDETYFEGIYDIDDGYAGKARPQYFTVSDDDLYDDMTDDDILALYRESAQEAFENNVSICTRNDDAFMEWAREQLHARKEAEEK